MLRQAISMSAWWLANDEQDRGAQPLHQSCASRTEKFDVTLTQRRADDDKVVVAGTRGSADGPLGTWVGHCQRRNGNVTPLPEAAGLDQYRQPLSTPTPPQMLRVIPRIEHMQRCERSVGGLGECQPNFGRQSRFESSTGRHKDIERCTTLSEQARFVDDDGNWSVERADQRLELIFKACAPPLGIGFSMPTKTML